VDHKAPWEHALHAFATDLRTIAEFRDKTGVFCNTWGGIPGPSDLLVEKSAKQKSTTETTALEVQIFLLDYIHGLYAEILFPVLLLDNF
jgi:hypothetical protein